MNVYNATLLERIDVTGDLIILRVLPDTGVPVFQAGQYVALGLSGSAPRPAHFPPETAPPASDKLIKRAYSIGSPPEERRYLEFYIAIVHDGALTSRMAVLRPSDRLFVAPKITGTFTLETVPSHANLCFISTGTGIAPFVSMLRTPTTYVPGRHITVVHGVRFAQDLAYRDELIELENQGRCSYFPTVSRDDQSWTGHRGRVQLLFENGTILVQPQSEHLFLCGNPAMIEDLQRDFERHGFRVHSKKDPQGTVHIEKYW